MSATQGSGFGPHRRSGSMQPFETQSKFGGSMYATPFILDQDKTNRKVFFHSQRVSVFPCRLETLLYLLELSIIYLGIENGLYPFRALDKFLLNH